MKRNVLTGAGSEDQNSDDRNDQHESTSISRTDRALGCGRHVVPTPVTALRIRRRCCSASCNHGPTAGPATESPLFRRSGWPHGLPRRRHTWNNLSDVGVGTPPTPFDFPKYLDFLEQHQLNFIRLWRWETTRWDAAATAQYTRKTDQYIVAPHPWRRSGPESALDGLPKFDLGQFEAAYFDRLRQRVLAARDRGIYVSIMLFEGWALQHLPGAWASHPFHPANNIQQLDGDAGGDGRGLLTHTLTLPAVTRLQETYVRHVIDTVNDLDNVLYEISNEAGTYSLEWQYHLLRFIKEYQQSKPLAASRRHDLSLCAR